MKGSIVITGGGTGGHLKVAKAFIDELHDEFAVDSFFIGSRNGQDKTWFENYRKLKKAIFLNTRGVVNKGFAGKILSMLQIFKETYRCIKFFDKNEVKTVISVGGFSAAPATFAAILTPGCKLYIHEQNSKMGKLNQITSKFATEVFSSYDKKSLIKDYPVSTEFFDEGRVRTELNTIIFLGGSQGAVAINNFALNVAPKLDSLGIKIIHQTGAYDFKRIKAEYENLNIAADVFDFSKDLVKKMNEADFAISRAGASTLWELSANSLPTLFVPYPYAAGDHQFLNAKFLKDRGLCFLSRENDLSEDVLLEAIGNDIHQISKNLASIISQNAVKKILIYILEENQK